MSRTRRFLPSFRVLPLFHLLIMSLVCVPMSGLRAATADAEEPSPVDAYQIMREGCAGAGEDTWVRCQRIAVNKSAFLRRECDDNQERARRVCMLRVMEQQNRDIQGATP